MIKSKTINAGPVAVKPKGAWSATYNEGNGYDLLDEVLHNYDSWISKIPDNKVEPGTDATKWFRSTQGGSYAKQIADQAVADIDQIVDEASNVDAVLVGMTVTITDRNGVSHSVDIGFDIHEVYESKAAMDADAANVPKGKFVMIATSDPTSVENARLYARSARPASDPEPFDFLSDLDQASSSAWAEWMDTQKPLIEQATSDANDAATLANTKAALADSKATLADEKATLANTKAGLADTAAQNADSKAALANNAAQNADGKALLADEKATLADQKATLANTAAQNADTKAALADNAATLANEKAQLADEKATLANTNAAYAEEQGDRAKAWADHPPYIADGTQAKPGDLNYWYVYDEDLENYVRDEYAKGDDLHWDEMTQQEKDDLADSVRDQLVMATEATCESIIDELT